jgi:DNA-binding GntR family transcriptional regulator
MMMKPPTSRAGSSRILTKKDLVAESIRREILEGAWPPGTRLRQIEVAERLDVSPTPVREAFGLLEAEGVIERHPHRGVVVADSHSRELRELIELRQMLERDALRRAMNRPSGWDVADLERTVEAAAEASLDPDLHGYRVACREFHERLASASGSAIVTELVHTLIHRSSNAVPYDQEDMRATIKAHAWIIDAVKRGDRQAARQALAHDLDLQLRRLPRPGQTAPTARL